MVPSRKYIMGRIPPPRNIEIIYTDLQTAQQIVDCIRNSVNDSMFYTDRYAHIFAHNANSVDDVCSDIWEFMAENFPYKKSKAETGDNQTGRTVRYIIYDPENLGRTYFDCKHYSIFAFATLKTLGIPCELRLTAYDWLDTTPTHVYVAAFDAQGNEYIIDGTMPNYNQESKGYQRTIVKEV